MKFGHSRPQLFYRATFELCGLEISHLAAVKGFPLDNAEWALGNWAAVVGAVGGESRE